MTEEKLKSIEYRASLLLARYKAGVLHGYTNLSAESIRDTLALVAEVRRQRDRIREIEAERDRLRGYSDVDSVVWEEARGNQWLLRRGSRLLAKTQLTLLGTKWEWWLTTDGSSYNNAASIDEAQRAAEAALGWRHHGAANVLSSGT